MSIPRRVKLVILYGEILIPIYIICTVNIHKCRIDMKFVFSNKIGGDCKMYRS